MRKTNTKIERYEHGDFYIDIVHEADGTYSAWLQHKDYGVSSMMFRTGDPHEPLELFLDVVEANLEDYIKIYRDDHMDQ